MTTSGKSESSAGLLLANYRPGLPMTTADMASIGIDTAAICRLVKKGWLRRIGRGAYCLPQDPVNQIGVIAVLLRDNPDLHAGGRAALLWQGVTHNAIFRLTAGIYGTRPFRLPAWIAGFSLRYQKADLFDFSGDEGRKLDESTLCVLNESPGLRCSVVERAMLEYLFDVCQKADGDREEAYNLMDFMCFHRREVFGALLGRCRSVQVKRLFIQGARRSGCIAGKLADFVAEYGIYLGSGRLSLEPVDRELEEWCGSSDPRVLRAALRRLQNC